MTNRYYGPWDDQRKEWTRWSRRDPNPTETVSTQVQGIGLSVVLVVSNFAYWSLTLPCFHQVRQGSETTEAIEAAAITFKQLQTRYASVTIEE